MVAAILARLRTMPASFISRSTSRAPKRATRSGSKSAKAARKLSRLRRMVSQLSPGREPRPARVPEHGGAGQPVLDGDEVGAAAADPAAGEELAEAGRQLAPGQEPVAVLAQREPGRDLGKGGLDGEHRAVAGGDHEA